MDFHGGISHPVHPLLTKEWKPFLVEINKTSSQKEKKRASVLWRSTIHLFSLFSISKRIHRKTQDVEVQNKIDEQHKDISKRRVLGCDLISCNRFHALHLAVFRQLKKSKPVD